MQHDVNLCGIQQRCRQVSAVNLIERLPETHAPSPTASLGAFQNLVSGPSSTSRSLLLDSRTPLQIATKVFPTLIDANDHPATQLAVRALAHCK